MRHKPRLVGLTLFHLSGLFLAGLLIAALRPAPAHAQERERCFVQTGHCVRGTILAYWERNGGVEVFGYPITDVRTETIEERWTGPVQWFERDRLEDHGLAGVQAGRLGAAVLEQRGHAWWDTQYQAPPNPTCVYSEVTRHNVCEPFLSYWQANGGVERFGYPLTAAFTETVGGWTGPVQYFERRRMEHHTDPASGTAQLLLGLLGNTLLEQLGEAHVCSQSVPPELRASLARVPFRSTLGCPTAAYQQAPAVVQPFERGRMLWFDLGAAGRKIFALSTMPALFQVSYDDTWHARQLASHDQTVPPGRLRPQQGFGKVWHDQEQVQQVLGWATAPEQPDTVTVQQFAHGWLVWVQQANIIYAFGSASAELVFFTRPTLTPGTPALLTGEPAPFLAGELVVRTQSVDFYRLPGALTAEEILALSTAVEQSIASGSSLLGSNLTGRVALRFEPEQHGPCAIRGLTLSNERTIYMYYAPGSNLWNIEAILAHEFVHQLQHDYYGPQHHLRSDVILLEGMAVWGSSPYYQDANGQPRYHAFAKQAMHEGILLPLTTSLDADCRTSTRNFIYDQWASFVEYLLITYGRERLDAVYADSTGRPAGSANYLGVYGKSLEQLESDWVAWLVARP